MSAKVPHFNVSSFDLGNGPTKPDALMMDAGKVPASAYTDEDRFARHRHRLTAVRRDATRSFRAPRSRSSEAGVSVERIV